MMNYSRRMRMLKVLFIFFAFCLLWLTSLTAQKNEISDLENALKNSKNDSERAAILNSLVDEFIGVDLSKAQTYGQQALDLTKLTSDLENKTKAIYNMGLLLYETDDRPNSLGFYKEAESLADALELKVLQCKILMSKSKFHKYVSRDSTLAVDNLFKTIEISKKVDYNKGTARAYAKLASFYTIYDRIDLSEKYLANAAEYYMMTETGKRTVAHYYNEVGDKIWDVNPKKSMELYFKGNEYAQTPSLMVSLAKAYNYIGHNEEALNYLEKAIPYFREAEKRRRMLGIAISQLAEVYIQMGDYDAALKYANEGISLLENLGRSDQRAMPALYLIKGKVSVHRNKEDEALSFYTKSHDEAIRIKQVFDRIKGLIAIGNFYLDRDIEKGKEVCNLAFLDAKKRKFSNLELQGCECLYQIYKKEESYVDALNYHERILTLSESISTIKIKHALEIKNKMSEKDNQLAEQTFQKHIKEEELKNQYAINNLLRISTFLGLLLIGFLALGYRRISNQNNEINEKTDELQNANTNLERSNEELERFAHITSHDLKSPLRNIVSFTGLLRHKLKETKNDSVDDLLNHIENSGKRMNQLIEDVLEFSSLSSDKKIQTVFINLNQLVDEIYKLTEYNSNLRPVHFEVSNLPSINWHYSKIFLLFKNLIENAIKYNESDEARINIYSESANGQQTICIQDNGIGIDKEHFDKVFIMFNRLHTHEEYEGTGLGLATCKKIVDEFNGNIFVSSEVNEGTIFKIEIPDELILKSELSIQEEKLVLQEH